VYGVLNNNIQVICSAAVVEAFLPVHFIAAASVVPGQCIKAIFEKSFSHTPDVSTGSIAFEPMRNYNEPARGLLQPVKVKKIVVRCGYPFAFIRDTNDLPGKGWIDRFQMCIEKKKWR
jgi:hypothetical protein